MNPSSLTPYSDRPSRRGVVGVIVEEQRFLAIRRSQQVVAPGAVCFPGGGIEPGEDERSALLRELEEELGLTVEPLLRLWTSVTPWGVDLAWWQCSADLSRVTPNPAEVASWHWFTAAEMRAIPELLISNHAFLDAVEQGLVRLDRR